MEVEMKLLSTICWLLIRTITIISEAGFTAIHVDEGTDAVVDKKEKRMENSAYKHVLWKKIRKRNYIQCLCSGVCHKGDSNA